MTMLVIGTCRVHEPAGVMRRRGIRAWCTGHRVHSTSQIYALVSHLTGREIYNVKNAHLLSDYSFGTLLTDGNKETIDKLSSFRAAFKDVTSMIIEISSFKQAYCMLNERKFYTNYFTKRDLQNNDSIVSDLISQDKIVPIRHEGITAVTFAPETIIGQMKFIADLLPAVPVTWVSHANILDEDDSLKYVRDVRDRLSSVVSEGALRLGHRFFDPTSVVRSLGQQKAFKKNGADIDHFSDEMLAALGDVYGSFAARSENSNPKAFGRLELQSAGAL